MALKLFRSTGYSSILVPGETRLAMHPAWLILLVSLWVGFACNVALWRRIRSIADAPAMATALLAGIFIAATCAALLSLLGWRRTLKRAATVVLLLAALVAASAWVQARPFDSTLLDQGVRSLLLPAWPSLLRWQFPVVLVVAGLLPMLWVWHAQLRRLPGQQQLHANLACMAVAIVAMVGSGWLLFVRG